MTDPMVWFTRSPEAAQLLGFIPDFLDPEDPRPAAVQFNERAPHCGGWVPIPGFKLNGLSLIYPGDPPMEPIAATSLPLTGEAIIVYEYALVLIVQPNGGGFEVSRLD